MPKSQILVQKAENSPCLMERKRSLDTTETYSCELDFDAPEPHFETVEFPDCLLGVAFVQLLVVK